jgi:hypothetical protein
MRLAELLVQQKKAILERCVSLTLQTYPHEITGFLSNEKDPFVNPIGHTLSRELEKIFDGLVSGADLEELEAPLDAIARIQAVQEFPPSEAVSFVFLLKQVVREELQHGGQGPELNAELDRLASRFDALVLKAFDVYVACRESIMDIRIREARKEYDRLLRLLQALAPNNPGR